MKLFLLGGFISLLVYCYYLLRKPKKTENEDCTEFVYDKTRKRYYFKYSENRYFVCISDNPTNARKKYVEFFKSNTIKK